MVMHDDTLRGILTEIDYFSVPATGKDGEE
jgi:hypothetical protein